MQRKSTLSTLQVRHPATLLIVAGLLTLLAVGYALRLRVLTGFESLLPESRPSVQELKRVASLTSGVSTMFIVLEGNGQTPVAKLRAAADALVPKLQELGPPWVGHAESGVQEALRFLRPRAGMFLPLPKLQELHDDIEERTAKALGEASGLFVDLEDKPSEPLTRESLKKRLELDHEQTDRYPDGYYQSRDGQTLVVLVRSKIHGSDFDRGAEAIARISAVVNRVNPASFHPSIRVGYSGDLVTAVSEYQAINRDLTDVGLFGSVLIGGVVFLYYLRLRTVLVMLLTIGVGVAWTFGATQLVVGSLNVATGFLFTIIAGNGINFGIIYMARYLEARRVGEALESALSTAARETWIPTLTAGFAAAASYGSLGATDFRGFHDFGLIGGMGMLLCWLATFGVMPCLLTVFERLIPLDRDFGGPLSWLRKQTRGGGVAFSRPFELLVARAPRFITATGLLLTALGLFGTVKWLRSDPMEYDLRNLRTDVSSRADEIRLNKLGDEITGHVGATGMAILVDRPDQVQELTKVLLARRAAAPKGKEPFERLHALQDFVPTDQAAKLPLLVRIRKRLVRAHEHGAISDENWQDIEPMLPPADLQPFGIAALPEGLARAFTESDGTRGRIVYIAPTATASVDDAHYLFRWADSYREARLSDGSLIRGSGRAVIYADMWAAIVHDVPIAVVLSFAATVLVVVLAFRGGRSSFAVLGSLWAGVFWMIGLLVVLKVKLNFLNFIALPITFGIGVDYSVNVVQRYVREGRGSALVAIRETGGAVILCSLTTILGYLALVRSTNFSVRSLGVAAFLGEICCLLASVLLLPAALVWIDRRHKDAAASQPSPPDGPPSSGPFYT